MRGDEWRQLLLVDAGDANVDLSAGTVETERWIEGTKYSSVNRVTLPDDLLPGDREADENGMLLLGKVRVR